MTSNTVFIHTNPKQRLGALVAKHSLTRNGATPGAFDVRIISTADTAFAFLRHYEGRSYLREKKMQVWRNGDLQSFAPLRFAVPELSGYTGRAIVMDPDIFAVGDIGELLAADMRGAAILARRMPATGRRPGHFASSVMLLDCARLRHWQIETDFEKLFAAQVDYRDWMWLLREPEGSVGELVAAWNDFDHLDASTRLLHNTHRRTQPWKTGLKADFTSRGTTLPKKLAAGFRRLRAAITGSSPAGYYQPHPDPAQEALFFGLLRECMDRGVIDDAMLYAEIERRHVRPDAFEKVIHAPLLPLRSPFTA